MSDEDLMEPEDIETRVQGLQKKMKLLLILLGVTLLVAIGSVGYAAKSASGAAAEILTLREDIAKVDSGKEEAMPGLVENDRLVGAMHNLGNFVVNLIDPGNVRYVNCRIEIEVEDDKLLSAIHDREAQMKDAVISLLGSRTYQDLAGLEGKTRLREELTARFNRILPKGQIARLYFTEFVIQ